MAELFALGAGLSWAVGGRRYPAAVRARFPIDGQRRPHPPACALPIAALASGRWSTVVAMPAANLSAVAFGVALVTLG